MHPKAQVTSRRSAQEHWTMDINDGNVKAQKRRTHQQKPATSAKPPDSWCPAVSLIVSRRNLHRL